MTHLSGRTRLDGIRSFLDSRGITVPETAGEEHTPQTVQRLGELKDRYLSAELGRNRVVAYPSTVGLLRTLRDHQTRVAAVSSSPVGTAVLGAAGITDLFDAIVTGFDKEKPLPMPALLRLTASRLDKPPAAITVVSTTPACLESARRESFGLVVGVSRSGLDRGALYQHGADLVVRSLADVPVVRRTSTIRRRA